MDGGIAVDKRRSRIQKVNLILNVILVLLLLVIIYYIVSNISILKYILTDPCKVCMEKTGATCLKVITP